MLVAYTAAGALHAAFGTGGSVLFPEQSVLIEPRIVATRAGVMLGYYGFGDYVVFRRLVP